MKNCVVIGGRSHPELVQRICGEIDIAPISVESTNFSNGESKVQIKDTVRERNVYIIQSPCGEVNENVMELLIMISACKAASAKTVTLVLPLFPYSRQATVRQALRCLDSESRLRTKLVPSEVPKLLGRGGDPVRLVPPPARAVSAPQSPQRPHLARQASTASYSTDGTSSANGLASAARDKAISDRASEFRVAQIGPLIAQLLSTSGADHIITMDLHDPQFQGFFDIPVDNLYGLPLLEYYIMTNVPDYKRAVIVSPDAGGAKRAANIADHLGTAFALVHRDLRINASLLVGDVSGKLAIIIDDMVVSARTTVQASRLLKEEGCTKVIAISTHGIYSGDALSVMSRSGIDQFVTTNTVPQTESQRILGDRLHVIDVSAVFGEAIRRIHNGESISLLFDHASGG